MDEAYNVLDSGVIAKMGMRTFNISDVSSILYRILLINHDEKYSPHSRFQTVYAEVEKMLNQHVHGFLDSQYMLACLGSGHIVEAKAFLESFHASDYKELHPKRYGFVSKLMEALIAFHERNYDHSTELFCSIKDSLVYLGGSDAQRDVFTLIMIAAAGRSNKEANRKLVKTLVAEREASKKGDPFISRLKCG